MLETHLFPYSGLYAAQLDYINVQKHKSSCSLGGEPFPPKLGTAPPAEFVDAEDSPPSTGFELVPTCSSGWGRASPSSVGSGFGRIFDTAPG